MKKIEYSKEALNKLKEIKKEIARDYGVKVADKVIANILRNIKRLEVFENSGTLLSSKVGIDCDYRYIYAEKNYIFYRVVKESVKILNVLNEKQDFMQILFGIKTTSSETEEYGNE